MSGPKIVDLGKRREEKRATPKDLLEAFIKMLEEEKIPVEHMLIVAHHEDEEGEGWAFAAMPNTTNKDILWIIEKTKALLMDGPGDD